MSDDPLRDRVIDYMAACEDAEFEELVNESRGRPAAAYRNPKDLANQALKKHIRGGH